MQNIKNTIAQISSIPEPGQLVEIRIRQWVVSDIKGQSLEVKNSNQCLTTPDGKHYRGGLGYD